MFITLHAINSGFVTLPCTLTGEYDAVENVIYTVQIEIPGGHTLDVMVMDLFKGNKRISDADLLQDLKEKAGIPANKIMSFSHK
jgi:hypothetical protein